MQIRFTIHYHTQWGQHIAIQTNIEHAPIIHCQALGDGWWEGFAHIEKQPKSLEYQYQLVDAAGHILSSEHGEARTAKFPKTGQIHIKDTWRSAAHPDNALFASAFESVVFRQQKNKKARKSRVAAGKINVNFCLRNIRVLPHQEVAILGSIETLGKWKPENAVALNNTNSPNWETSIQAYPWQNIEYKYILRDRKTGQLLHWETGENRQIMLDLAENHLIVNDEYFRHPQVHWKGTGIAFPVFSLRTAQSLGSGDFTDLKILVDWAVQMNMQMVQILPVNDTTATHSWVDSYPYAAISVFALHPLYLNLDALEHQLDKKTKTATQTRLNANSTVDYEATMAFKLNYARKVFKKTKTKLYKNKTFLQFIDDNAYWLKSYAAFSHFRDENGTVNFTEWTSHTVFEQSAIDQLCHPKSKTYDDIAFHYYLQYHLDKQLAEAADYARQKGIVLKGDIPIGIYRYSADAWVAPQLYNMDGQAGAPPDDFAEAGQNWGFPTYDWAVMAEDDYSWWKSRFSQLSRYFDAFRIDHILGFFRIWETPIEQVEGILGVFNPALPIHINELHGRGIAFSRERFCEPYITTDLLRHLFGNKVDEVIKDFLSPLTTNQYQLKSGFRTQREIQAALSEEQKHLEKGLFSLVSNVLLFEVEDSNGTYYHPRIELAKTLSYQSLDDHSKWQLKELHDDYFYHRQEDFWREKGLTKLPAMKAATEMLICGEDLGMVPTCVPEVMKDLGILSLEIQRMSKNPETEFLHERDIPYWSVISPSTHDMSPLRLWWEEEPYDRRQRFYTRELGLPGHAPEQCTPELAEAIISQHLHWPGMWVVFPFQDLIAMDEQLRRSNAEEERINIPANIPHYWNYRMHLTLEELVSADEFNGRVRELIAASSR